MASKQLQRTLASALPRRRHGMISAADFGIPDVSATFATAAGNSNAAGGVGPVEQMLQSTLKDAGDTIKQSNEQLTALLALQEQVLNSTNQNTQALNANTTAKGSSGSKALSTLGSVAENVFGGSILTSLFSGISDLFGGSKPATVLPSFSLPVPVQVNGAINAPTAAQAASYAQGSFPSSAAAPAAARQTPVQQVQIQVNALDSRSIMDHSDEIASAVRQALLSSHSLADVIAEL